MIFHQFGKYTKVAIDLFLYGVVILWWWKGESYNHRFIWNLFLPGKKFDSCTNAFYSGQMNMAQVNFRSHSWFIYSEKKRKSACVSEEKWFDVNALQRVLHYRIIVDAIRSKIMAYWYNVNTHIVCFFSLENNTWPLTHGENSWIVIEKCIRML